MVQEKAHTRTLAPSLYRGEGSRLGTSLLTPDCSTGCKTTFLLLCGLAWKTLPLQSATLCCLKGCCFALGEPSSGTGRDLWCSARRSCLPVLSSLVLKKQNMHQQNRVLCLGLWLQFLLHLRVMPDVSVGWVLLVNWYYFYSKNRAGSLGRQWARHEGWFRFGLLLVGLGWGFFFFTFLLAAYNDDVIFLSLTQESDSTNVLVTCLFGMPENSNPLIQDLSWGSGNPS